MTTWRRTSTRGARGSACRCRERSGAPCHATSSSDWSARPSTPRRASLPAGQDVVVVARPPARELAEQEGLEGIRRALDELLEKALAAAPAR